MRLKKGPDIEDYLVELNGENHDWFFKRSEARDCAKELRTIDPEARVRVFRATFNLVSDSGAKRKARRK